LRNLLSCRSPLLVTLLCGIHYFLPFLRRRRCRLRLHELFQQFNLCYLQASKIYKFIGKRIACQQRTKQNLEHSRFIVYCCPVSEFVLKGPLVGDKGISNRKFVFLTFLELKVKYLIMQHRQPLFPVSRGRMNEKWMEKETTLHLPT
jgi:hypothetical protein